MMTAKDFELVADEFARSIVAAEKEFGDLTVAQEALLLLGVGAFMRAARISNPRFDAEKFYKRMRIRVEVRRLNEEGN